MTAEKSMLDEALLKSFQDEILDKPEVFLTRKDVSAEQAKSVTKYLYDLGKSTETESLKGQGSMLEELFIDGFDNDQIWEEIHMQNTPFMSFFKSQIKTIKLNKSESSESKENQDNDEEEDGEEEEISEEADMSLGLDEDDMGIDMDDTDNMEGFSGEDEEMEEEDDLEEEDGGDDDEEEEDEDEDEEEEELDDLDLPVKKKSKTSEVDDDFFNLEEFNELTEKQEQDELEDDKEDDDEEEIDYFADPDLIDSGDDEDDLGDMDGNEDEVDAHDVSYKDFFAPPERGMSHRPKAKSKPKKDDEDNFFGKRTEEDEEMGDENEDSDSAEVNALGDRVSNLFGIEDEEDEETEKLSKFEKSQRKLREQIDELEQENVAAKDWTKKGEASSSDRPVNSLLEEELDFETVAKPIPVITAESTKTLEDIIKERILAANFDDVVRKAPPNAKAFNPSSRVEISDEKSKKSLAELYEDDYVRQTSTAGPVMSEREAALEKKHEEITQLWQELCQKLDSLSNWHYTPKPPKAELTVVTNAPAISMEEAIPVSVADASLLAPEEVYSAGKAPVLGETEMDQAERKRKRAQAKKVKKVEIREKARKEAERKAEREARDRRLGREVGDKGNSKTIVRDKLDAVKSLSGQKNISFIDRDGNKRSSIKGTQAAPAQGSKLKL